MCRRQSNRGRAGFTLTELLVTLAISLLLMAGIYQFFIRQQRTYSTQDEVSRLQAQARTAQDFLVRAIQQAGAYSPQTGQTISLRGQVILAASDRYLTIQYDDPFRTGDLGIITEEEVVTFAVSKEKPSAATGANDYVRDAAVAGVNTTAVYFDQNRANGVESTERFALSIPLTLKGPTYTLYRVTPDRQSPTDASRLRAEPIASDVENLVFHYYDQNGNPIPRDNATGAALPAPYVLTPQQRAMIRSVEVELALRTTTSDKAYSVTFNAADNTVATYDAGGNPRSGVSFANDGFRRRVFKTKITPRNLSANNCGSLTLLADNAQPPCPQSTTIRAVVQNKYGDPVNNATVRFTAEAGSLSAASATTNAGGEASTTLSYSGLARSITVSASAVVDCSPGGPPDFTLINAVAVDFVPGPPSRINIQDVSATQINTCTDAPVSWTFTATALDDCGNLVPPVPGVAFQVLDDIDPTHPVFGTVTPADFTAQGQVFTVTPPSAGPYTAHRDVNGLFRQVLSASGGWFGGFINPAPKVNVKAWIPQAISLPSWTTNISSLVNHTDCPSPAVGDAFQVVDCYGNWVVNLGGGYSVLASLLPDGLSPALNQGTLSSTNNPPPPPPPAAQAVTIAANAALGWFNTTYTPPDCVLSPASGTPNLIHPTIKLELLGSHVPSVNPPHSRPLNLQRCATCDLTANPAVMTECTGVTTITVSGCNLDRQTVELEVTSSGRPGSFSQGSIVTNVTLTFAGSSPSVASTRLYLGLAQNGDNLTVKAYYPNKAAKLWECDPVMVPVSSECQKLEMFSDAGYSQLVGNNSGNEDCLSHIENLYFEVTDCQDSPATLRNAIRVYAVANGGAWVDMEELDIRDSQLSNGVPIKWRATRALPVIEAASPRHGDGVLAYPAGKAVQILAEYQDVVDGSDPVNTAFQVLGAAPAVPLVALHRCQKVASLAAPLPICFPNAITSGGGGTWNGNYKVHWGDVVIRGTADPAAPVKRIAKTSAAAVDASVYSGNGNVDRFFDIYVGKKADGSEGFLVGGNQGVMQPFQPDGLGNYFHGISYSKITEMMAELDYDTMKGLAKERGAYWYTLPSGQIRNHATNKQASLETVLSLSGPGRPNDYYDGKFIFVDTFGAVDPGPATNGNDINLTATASLPTFSLGGIYTEGIIYVTGSVEYRSGGGGANISIKSPPILETRYDHNAVVFNETMVPIRPDPARIQNSITLSDINVNGGVYVKGEILFAGSPKIFGAVSAERGFLGNGTPEIWYNYSLNQSNADTVLCVTCCTLELSPNVAELAIGGQTQLNPRNAAGAITWSSEDPTVATVSGTGVVSGVRPGITRVRAADANNCSAWATITVLPPCSGFAVSPGGTTINAGGTQLFTTNAPASASIQWSSSNPAVATIGQATGLATAVGQGTAVITAHDANGVCTDAQAFLTVNPLACTLSVAPGSAAVGIGGTVALATAGAQGSVTWSSSAPGVATVSPASGASTNVTGMAEGSVTITATDQACARTATVTVSCPVGFSDDFSDNSLGPGWTAQNIGAATAGSGQLEDAGNLTITGTDGEIGGSSDETRFVYRNLKAEDDFVVTVKVESVEKVANSTQAALMVRDSLLAGAKFVALAALPVDNNNRLLYRTSDNINAVATGGNPGLTAPAWLRLSKSGSVYTAYFSNDGVAFTQYAQAVVTTWNNIWVGLAVSSNKNNQTAKATFDNFTIQCP